MAVTKNQLINLLGAGIALTTSALSHADLAPESASVSFKYLDYQDAQPGKDRIHVGAPALSFVLPVAGEWALGGVYIHDAISGASPAYHTRALTNLKDKRNATSLNLTKYFPKGFLTLGSSYSKERDYKSVAFSVSGSLSTEDKNTTFNAGVSVTNDAINPTNQIVIDEKKHITDFIFGVTQVMGAKDIAQINVGYSNGNGYFTDPYKLFDQRPRERDHTTILGKWNHYFDKTNGTARMSYRYYWDTFNIDSHTLALEYLQPFGEGWVLSPTIRYYSQDAASFYVEVDPSRGSLQTYPSPSATYNSRDQRLSEYGAISVALKLSKQIDKNWLVDIKYERYEQRSDLSIHGNGSVGLDPFYYDAYQIGATYTF